MDDFTKTLKDKLISCGASEQDLSIALHGDTKEQSLKSLNVYLAAHSKDNDKISSLRSFTIKGQEQEILERVDDAAKALSKHVFKKAQ